MRKFKRAFGIDVSKDTLDLFNSSKSHFSEIRNTKKSISKWVEKLDPKSDLCVFEPTGSYPSKLLRLLCGKGLPIKLANPVQGNGFTKAQGIISENDKQAAMTLALPGQCLGLPLFKKPEDTMCERKQLPMGINALKKQQQMLKASSVPFPTRFSLHPK